MRALRLAWLQAAAWLLGGARAAPPEGPGCHACQLLVQVLQEKVGEVASGREAKQGQDSRKRQTAAALRAGAVSDVLDDAGVVCKAWKTDPALASLAVSLSTTSADLAKQCATQLDLLRDPLETALRNSTATEEALRTAVCLGRPGKKRRGHPCARLWTAEERPLTRGEAARRAAETAAAEAEEAALNAAREREFLARNAEAEGVAVIPGTAGLQEKLLHRGEGTVRPGQEDNCLVHYQGALLDCEVQPGPEACAGGTVFDSTHTRGRPATFSPKLAGSFWVHALPRMVRGDRREFYVPHAAGFGSSSESATAARQFKMVGPNATLIFTVELIGVKGKDEPPKASSEL